jgi:hypothetical protein
VQERLELGRGEDEGVAAGGSGVLAVVEKYVTGVMSDPDAFALVVTSAGFSPACGGEVQLIG